MLKVRNMEGSCGREVANQFILEGNNQKCFQSYESVCAVWERSKRKLTLGCDCLYSRTTAKYLYQFIKEETPIEGVDRKVVLEAMNKGELDFDGYKIVYDDRLV